MATTSRTRSDSAHEGLKAWLFAVVLSSAVAFIYQPAWHGGFVWDDEQVIADRELQSLHGLYRVWFDISAAQQQYYPLAFSVLWVERKVWGDTMLGYHFVNIVLHVLCALLVLRVLQRLAIPGAFLASALFALHPLQVESVAWIVELKNILSTIFYLGAAIAYLRFDQSRKAGNYVGALALFLMALLCKTATLTLPAALLVVFWWQRGRWSWQCDVVPLLPFFVVGAMAGCVTLWVESKPLLDLAIWQRCLLPGRTSWFYLWKLFWPAGLTPIYPRWNLDEAIAWQCLLTLGMALLIVAAWAIRKSMRGPFAALVFFLGSLFPVLGLFHPAYFDHSFVADHFVYLPSIGMFAIFSAGVAGWLHRSDGWRRSAWQVACAALLTVLGILSWRQSHAFNGIEAHSRATLAGNPRSFAAHSNLGVALTGMGKYDEAIAHYRKAIDLAPPVAALHVNVGAALYGSGQRQNAMAEYRAALQIDPEHAEAHHSLGNLLVEAGWNEEALVHFRKAVELKPQVADYRNNLGVLLLAGGRVSEAIAQFRRSAALEPLNVEAHYGLGRALAAGGQDAEAVVEYEKALEIQPQHAKAHYDLALALNSSGKVEQAILHYQNALEANPGFAEALNNLAVLFVQQGRLDEARDCLRRALEVKPGYQSAGRNLAIVESERDALLKVLAERREAIRARPDDPSLLNDTAWMLATNPNASLRNGADAVAMAQRAVQLTGGGDPVVLATLAAAYAETGRFSDAVATAHRAHTIAAGRNLTTLADLLQSGIRRFRAKSPFRLPPQHPR